MWMLSFNIEALKPVVITILLVFLMDLIIFLYMLYALSAPQRLYPQLELDELLSPDNRPRLPELRLSSSHLQPEPLPPVHSQ